MDTLRIFISSPGDVAEERERARQVVQGLRRRYAQHFALVPVFWEDMPLTLDMSFQQGIELVLSRDRGVDVAVFILWSRLGSPLGPRVTKEDGSEYRSGTEREQSLMLAAREAQGGQRPQILAYARQDEASFEEALRGRSTAEKEELLRQKKLVETFLKEEFHDAETGTNVRAYHTFSRPQTFAERLRVHLQEILDGLCAGRPVRPVWEIDTRGPPFRGLEAFAFEHAEIFFGREDEVAEARVRLTAAARRGTAFLLIGGASGTGKSSLAAAGLVPEIVAHETDEQVGRWLHAALTPAALAGDPAAGMARILAAAVPELGMRGDNDDFAAALARDPVLAVKLVLLPALKASARPGSGGVRLVLLVDQLEELFSDPRLGPPEQAACAEILGALATSGSVWVVATLRGDWYPRLLECPALVALKTAGGQLDLVPPEIDAVRRMIESPAALAGLTYEQTGATSLADRILRDVADRAELLPLLEDLLRELFERRSPTGLLTAAAYESLGGIEGSLAKRAETSLAALPVEVQLALPEVLRRLVATGEKADAAAVRRRAPLEAFATGSPARRLVDRLVADRLATASAGEDGRPEVTIAHEAILRVWPRAAAWIRDNAEFLRVRDRLMARMRDQAPLTAADPLLPAAQALLETQPDAIEPDLAAYVEAQLATISADRRRRDRLRRAVVGGLTALSAAATITAAAALWQWREANQARKSESTQRLLAEKSKAETTLALGRAEAESSSAKRRLYLAKLYKLQNALESPERKLASACFQEAMGAYRDAYGPDVREPIELLATRPLLSDLAILKGHDSSVTCIAFSPDGTRVATGSVDHTVRLWDVMTGESVAVLSGHQEEICVLAFSPDGARLASGSVDKTVRLWDVSSGAPLVVLSGHDGVIYTLAFSPDGTLLATGSRDLAPRLWNCSTGQCLAVLEGHKSMTTSLAYSPDGKRIATGSWDKTARIWDAFTGDPLLMLRGHDGGITRIAFTPDGTRLATGSSDATARLWDAATGELQTILEGHEETIDAIAFSPDGARLATGSNDSTVRLWDVVTGTSVAGLTGHDRAISALAFSPDGTRLATASEDSTARLWDAATAETLAVLRGHEHVITCLAFSPDGMRVATGSVDYTARLWHAWAGDSLAVLRGHESPISVLALSPDGTRVATGSFDNMVRLWDTSTCELLAEWKGHTSDISCLAFSPDGTQLATGSRDSTARLWDTSTGELLALFAGHGSWVQSLGFSPDGTRLATGSNDSTARIWDTSTGGLALVLKGHQYGICGVVFSPNGTWLATGSNDTTVRLWNAMSGETLAILKGAEGSISVLSFSPDSARLATGSISGAGRIWDSSTGQSLAILTGHEASVSALAFSPDGTRLVTASSDRTARIWEAATGELRAVLRGHDGGRTGRGELLSILCLAYSPDGTRLFTGGVDGTVRVWDMTTGESLAVLKGHERGVSALTFSADGMFLVTGSWDDTARVWGISNGDIHANRLAARALRERLAPVVDAWFAADRQGTLELVKANLAAARATMPPPDWREAANLVLIKAAAARAKTASEQASAATPPAEPAAAP